MSYGGYYEALAGGLIVVAIFGIIALLIGLALYVLGSYATMVMAQKRGIENAWLAWIPVANTYLVGKIVKDCDIATYNINKLEMVLPIALVVNYIFSNLQIPLISPIILIAAYVLYIFTCIKLFKMYAPQNLVLYTILSCIGLIGIMMFIVKDKEPVEVAATGKPIFQQ